MSFEDDRNLEETYNKRKQAFSSASRVYRECLDSYEREKKKMIDEAVRAATLQAEQDFNDKYRKDVDEAQKLLKSAEMELSLLKCPKDKLHSRVPDQYYRCKLCGFVWDDTSPAHF